MSTISNQLDSRQQTLTITNEINKDEDVPYAGSATVNLSLSRITLYNAGERRFATQGSDNYDGTGTTPTTAFVASTAGSNATSVTWYVGENIQPAVTSIKVPADRNRSKAPKNACYIRVAPATLPISENTTPKIGEEYTLGGTKHVSHYGGG